MPVAILTIRLLHIAELLAQITLNLRRRRPVLRCAVLCCAGCQACGVCEFKYSARSSADGCVAMELLGSAVGWGGVVGLRAVGRGRAMVLYAAATECVACVGADLPTLGDADWKLPGFRVFRSCWNFISEVDLFTVGTLDCKATV